MEPYFCYCILLIIYNYFSLTNLDCNLIYDRFLTCKVIKLTDFSFGCTIKAMDFSFYERKGNEMINFTVLPPLVTIRFFLRPVAHCDKGS